MYDDVKEWVNTCRECAMRKGSPHQKYGPAVIMPSTAPFETIGMDITGPFTTTRLGNKSILVFTDHFTKWVEVFAIQGQDAETIAKHYVEGVICRHGAPRKVISDRAKNFIGHVMEEINTLLGVKHAKTSGYHPQTNGVTERFNKTLLAMLSMYVSAHQKDWDVYLPYVAFAYNTSVHSSTNETPYFLMHGRDPYIIADQQQLAITETEFKDVPEYRQHLVSALTRIRQEVNEYKSKIEQQRDIVMNEERIKHPFKLGDLVWLYTKHVKKGLSPKLISPWHGPFRIIDLPFETNARLARLDGKPFKQLVHVTRLKKFNSPEKPRVRIHEDFKDNFMYDEEMEDVAGKYTKKRKSREEEEDEEYVVEDILDMRCIDGKLEYLIKWFGYSKDLASWEPEKHTINCADKVRKIHQKKGLICSNCQRLMKTKKGLKNHLRECLGLD
jgi:hypothetical protein